MTSSREWLNNTRMSVCRTDPPSPLEIIFRHLPILICSVPNDDEDLVDDPSAADLLWGMDSSTSGSFFFRRRNSDICTQKNAFYYYIPSNGKQTPCESFFFPQFQDTLRGWTQDSPRTELTWSVHEKTYKSKGNRKNRKMVTQIMVTHLK